MKKIYIIGAGQLGSRHLQALKNVKTPLEITVIDPSEASLKTAKERYEGFNGIANHPIKYSLTILKEDSEMEIVIVATNSNFRRAAVEQMLKMNKAKYFILEKYLFDKKADYLIVGELLKKSGSTAWVNCSMRKMPFYNKIKEYFNGKAIHYTVTGSQYGLVTNLVHFIDHISYLTGSSEYEADAKYLDPEPIPSKRKGFLEFNGIFQAHFKNGSHGMFRCYPSGELPMQVEIFSEDTRLISREWEGKVWVSRRANKWVWEEIEAKIPYQSQMTTELVEELIEKGTCPLAPYEESAKLHLLILDSLLMHLNKYSEKKYDYYPFT